MPSFSPVSYEDLLKRMIARVVARAGLYDVSDTAVVKHILASCARAVDELYYQASLLKLLFNIDTATGPDLDARAAEIQPGDLQRMVAVSASGQVVFSRSVVAGSVTIPIGTQVKTGTGAVFATTEVGIISHTSAVLISGHTAGQDSQYVGVTAVTPGTAGNVAANTLVKFNSKPVGVDTVTNPLAMLHGQDEETDDSFRGRLKSYIAGLARSTVASLESCVLGATLSNSNATILFSKAVEDTINLGNVVLYIDDGTGTALTFSTVTAENMTLGLSGPPTNTAVGGETRLYLKNVPVKPDSSIVLTSTLRESLSGAYTVDTTSGLVTFNPPLATGEEIDATYTYYTGLVQLAQKIVDGDPNNRAQYPGYRAAGVRVLVQTPQIVLTNVSATLTVADGYDPSAVQAAVVAAIQTYINSLQISGDVLRAQIYSVVMAVPGVSNVVLSTPTTDLTILDSQLARTQISNIVVN